MRRSEEATPRTRFGEDATVSSTTRVWMPHSVSFTFPAGTIPSCRKSATESQHFERSVRPFVPSYFQKTKIVFFECGKYSYVTNISNINNNDTMSDDEVVASGYLFDNTCDIIIVTNHVDSN